MPDITLHDLDKTAYAAIRRTTVDENLNPSQAIKPAPRRLGDWKGLVRIAPDFDEWPDDLAEAFGMRGGTTP